MAAKKTKGREVMVQHRINIVVVSSVTSPSLAEAVEAGKAVGIGKLIAFKPGVSWLDGEVKLTGVYEE